MTLPKKGHYPYFIRHCFKGDTIKETGTLRGEGEREAKLKNCTEGEGKVCCEFHGIYFTSGIGELKLKGMERGPHIHHSFPRTTLHKTMFGIMHAAPGKSHSFG